MNGRGKGGRGELKGIRRKRRLGEGKEREGELCAPTSKSWLRHY